VRPYNIIILFDINTYRIRAAESGRQNLGGRIRAAESGRQNLGGRIRAAESGRQNQGGRIRAAEQGGRIRAAEQGFAASLQWASRPFLPDPLSTYIFVLFLFQIVDFSVNFVGFCNFLEGVFSFRHSENASTRHHFHVRIIVLSKSKPST
jgi:hypothetical protein